MQGFMKFVFTQGGKKRKKFQGTKSKKKQKKPYKTKNE